VNICWKRKIVIRKRVGGRMLSMMRSRGGENRNIKAFLSRLTIESIDRTIFSFEEGISSHTALRTDFDPRRAQLACSRILRMTEKKSTAMNNVYEIPKFWINLNGLMHSSNLNIIESCITRAYCMQGALNFHYWLIDIVRGAVQRASYNTWIDKLATNVQTAINGKRTVTFNSADYLPNLTFHKVYSYAPKPFRYNQMELITSTVSSILRLWLHFPSDEASLVQLSLIDIVSSQSPSSILFLDKIWEMYATPFSTVFDVWNGRTSKGNINRSLDEFQKLFLSHPFAIAGSLENQKLEYLKTLIAKCMENSGLDSDVLIRTGYTNRCSAQHKNKQDCYQRSANDVSATVYKSESFRVLDENS
jgi:hypothetical protein